MEKNALKIDEKIVVKHLPCKEINIQQQRCRVTVGRSLQKWEIYLPPLKRSSTPASGRPTRRVPERKGSPPGDLGDKTFNNFNKVLFK
jgi:hypothetical protein